MRFESPVQKDDIYFVGDSQDVTEAPIDIGDRASSHGHHTEHASTTQVTDCNTAGSEQ